MPSKDIYDTCICGSKKQKYSKHCRNCYKKQIPRFSCIECGKSRKKTISPICRDCYNSKRTNYIINDKTPIGTTFYSKGSQNKYNFIRSHARRLFETLSIEKICACCKFEHGIQICHIQPISSFSEKTPICEVNSLDNLILLCPNCHWLFDHGYSSLEDLKNFYKQTRTIIHTLH